MNYCRFNLNILLLSQIHSCSAGFRTDMDYNENKQTKNGRGLILNAKILLYWQDIKKAYLPLRLTLYLTILKKVIWILLTHNHPLLMPQLSTKSNESQLDSFLHDLIHKHGHQTRLSPLWWEFWYHTIMETKYLIYKNNNVVSFYEVNFYTQIVV